MTTALTSDEVHDFLRNQRTLILATTKRDGAPVAHPVWFVYLDGAVYFNIQRESFKHRNIQRDGRVSCLIEAGEQYLELRGVMIQGRCVEVTDAAERARVEAEQAAKDARIGGGMADMPAWFSESRQRRLDQGARVLLKVPLEQVTSWDFSKIRGRHTGSRNRKPPPSKGR